MLRRPQFKPHLHVEPVKDEGVFLMSERGHSVLNGHLFELLAPLIDGRRSVDDIVDALQPDVSPAHVYFALTQLERKGYLGEADATFAKEEAGFWTLEDIAPQTAARQLAEIEVAVTAFGDVARAPFVALLESLHVRVGDGGAFGAVLTDDYLHAELSRYNREALRSRRSWILIKPVGRQILIGPVFSPDETGCWECLARRLRANRAVEMFVQRRQRREQPLRLPSIATPATEQIAYGMAATEIARWIVRRATRQSKGEVLSLDVASWQTRIHALARQPDCAACSEAPAQRPARPLVLDSCKKTFMADGGHRVVAPEETLRKYEHHVSPVTGVVSGLQRHVAAADGPIHVYRAGGNPAAPFYNLRDLRQHLRSGSAGKGTTDLQARASGLCEALERYSGAFHGTEIRRKATFKELDGLGIHPNECMRFSARQYAERQIINAKGPWHCHVPAPFDEEAEVEWTPVWSLTHQAHRYLPTEYCYYAYPSPAQPRYCVACSNGSAAGNTLEEAILQGFLELVERDSVALWWYNRVQRPSVDLDSFDDPYLVSLRSFLEVRGRDLWALDLTSDLGVPVCAALSRRTSGPQEQILLGFGAHLDARVALLRAVTEVNQMLVWLLADDTDAGVAPEIFEHADTVAWLQTATAANQPYLVPDASIPPRTRTSYLQQWTDDLRDDVLLCQDMVERRGMEMLVLDQTRAEIGLPVVKVIVPGLRHFWPRFASGRLYEVPVRLGWLRQALTEQQLNPTSFFF